MQTNVWRSASCALFALGMLTACSGDDEATVEPTQDETGTEEEATSTDEGGTDEGGTDEGDASGDDGGSAPTGGAGVEDIDVDDVIVEQTVSMPDNPDDKATFGVHSLQVEGDVMVLRMLVTPDFTSESDSDAISLFHATGQVNFRPTLVDTANLKEYSVIGSGAWGSNPVAVKSVNGEPMLAWAYFAAPEDDIDAIDLRVGEFWPAFTDVPITR